VIDLEGCLVQRAAEEVAHTVHRPAVSLTGCRGLCTRRCRFECGLCSFRRCNAVRSGEVVSLEVCEKEIARTRIEPRRREAE
jgi:2-iminoacetate synthase ThiH